METDGKKTILICLTGNLISDQRMQRIAGALSEDGHRVTVYYRLYAKYGEPLRPPGSFPFETVVVRCPVKEGVLFYLAYNFLLFFRLLFKKSDMYYAVDSDTLPAVILLSVFRSRPFAYDAHEYFAEVPELSGKNLKKNIWHFVTRLGVRLSAIRITVGESLAEELKRRYGKAFVSIRNVPELKDKEAIVPEENAEPVIIYQGALNKGRMLEMLIDFISRHSGFRCIIAGEGDLSASLRARSGNCGRIDFAGLLSPEKLKEITPRCFAGYNLLDAGDSLSYHYSLSNKYFDYMHAGIPSLSSELPEYEELNSKWNCGVCIPPTEEALTDILLKWKNDRSHYAGLKENAKFAAAHNHWDLEKQKLKALFRS